MKRLMLAAVWAGIGAGAMAKPPVEHLVQGKERTPLERDLHLPEQVLVAETVPGLPMDRSPIRVEVLTVGDTILRLTRMPLGVVPLIPPVMW